jgi:hypothetical protein
VSCLFVETGESISTLQSGVPTNRIVALFRTQAYEPAPGSQRVRHAAVVRFGR